MFIGSAPSSTAGGIRTTTFAICLLGIWSLMMNKSNTNFGKKRIPDETVKKSFGVFTISVIYVFITTGIIILDSYDLLINTSSGNQIFGALLLNTSAFGTVGLSPLSNPEMMQLGTLSGIAASKSKDLYILLSKKYKVNLIVTNSAKKFVELDGIESISNEIFSNEKIQDPHTYANHIEIAQESTLNIIYPATYNFIGKIANGIADDFASLLFSVSKITTLIFPSMNTDMYLNPIFIKNKEILLNTNNTIWVEPKVGLLASRDLGIGRSYEPQEAYELIERHLDKFNNLENKKVLLNFGRTRSYIDKVSLHNKVKDLKIFYGDVDFKMFENNNQFYCKTNQEMLDKMLKHYQDADIVICCAALNDFEIQNPVNKKIEKDKILNDFSLIKSIDVLNELGKSKKKQFLVGFSLGDEFDLDIAFKKMNNKNLDMIILNKTNAMSSDDNEIIVLFKDKTKIKIESNSKAVIAERIIQIINKNDVNSKKDLIDLSKPLISLKDVTKIYGKKEALKNINFEINPGDRIGVIGPNGGGKSTMSEIIAGIRKPTSGTVEKQDNLVIGIQFQESKYPLGITVIDMIRYYLETFNIEMTESELTKIMRKFQIESLKGKFISSLSGGQQQRVNILLSIINNPDLVILDEVSTGLDIEVRSEIFKEIKEQIVEKNKAILLVTHMMSEIEELCDKFIYIHNGEIRESGLVKDIVKKYGSVHNYT
ncbi:hypothetical protein FQR65_LT16666 [Abscondita terminalis]|nr:hypothetical protein FQR65_LT16666 [Abscondita terminalis]